MKHALIILVGLFLGGCIFPRAGQPVHVEFIAKDPQKLGTFYEKLYGWEVKKWEGPGSDYWLVDTPGMQIGGGILPESELEGDAKDMTGPTTYIYVDDIDTYLKKAESLGAKVLAPKMAVPKVGFVAVIEDPEGNVTGMFQYDPKGGTKMWEEQRQKEEK